MVELCQAFEHLGRLHLSFLVQCRQGPVDPVDDSLRSLLPLPQQFPLCDQVTPPAVRRCVKHLADRFQPEPQFAQQPDLSQPVEVPVIVLPIAVRRPPGRDQQPDPVVVVQGAHGHAGQRGNLADGVEVGGGGWCRAVLAGRARVQRCAVRAAV